MGLFKVLSDVALMPVRLAVDVVRVLPDAVEGEIPLKSTRDGLKKLARDLNEDEK